MLFPWLCQNFSLEINFINYSQDFYHYFDAVGFISRVCTQIIPKKLVLLFKRYYAQIPHNQFPNMLRLFDVLANFPFTTSETMHDYYL